MEAARLDEASQHAALLGVAVTIAHEWHEAGVPLLAATECIRNVLSHFLGDVGITHAVHDAVEHRKAHVDLYPEWVGVNVSTVKLATLALGVWVRKGWRR
jgi:hypothetical protein